MTRNWKRYFVFTVLLVSSFSFVSAQESPLAPVKSFVTLQEDAFGQPVQVVRGMLVNTDTANAYGNINLSAEAFDAAGASIGEGFGYLVKACGQALAPDFALQPGAGQAFWVTLDLDEPDLTVDHVALAATGDPQPAAPSPTSLLLTPGLTQVSRLEVAGVEWLDGETLRFGDGCRDDLFINWAWHDYNLRTGVQQDSIHPKTELVTPSLRRALVLDNDGYFRHSRLSFQPGGRRLVYQTDLNGVITAEPDGSFKRVLFERLSDRSLASITWVGKGVFVAAYFGATGDPVTYFSATGDGKLLSETPQVNPASLTLPGASPDGQRLIIGLNENGVEGYYLKRSAYPGANLLFASPLPGNNWPAPLWEQDADGVSFLYVAVPSAEGAQLQCYNFQTQTLHEQITLPLRLESDERAWWALAPDNNSIALVADGLNGGLWTIELAKLPGCG